MLELTKEMRSYHIRSHPAIPKIHCKVFEDNNGALEMARTPKLRPHTKHINNAYHHFREYTQPSSDSTKPTVEIVSVSTDEQIRRYANKTPSSSSCHQTPPDFVGMVTPASISSMRGSARKIGIYENAPGI